MNVLEKGNIEYDQRGRRLIRVYMDADNLEHELSHHRTTSGFPFNFLIERPVRWFLDSVLERLVTKFFNRVIMPVLEKGRKTYERIFRR